jgi:penicillin-binding protein 1C
MRKWLLRYYKYLLVILVTASAWYYFALPSVLFTDPYSTVLESSKGELLCASIALDGQWRFPQQKVVSGKFSQALVLFEDKRFHDHEGVDVLSLARAFRQNLRDGHVVSGGSTITMQVIRLSRKNKSRTFFEKVIELILATRLELRYSKEEILSLYASHAPFGGNVVGLEAACWRYFGRSAESLSWAEASMLAVLPNAPSLIHPGKNRDLLKRKRDKLLERLKQNGIIDDFTCELAKSEALPDAPLALPRYARHLLARAAAEGKAGTKIISTLSYPLQLRVEQIVQDHHQRLKGNQIFNACALVLDVNSGNVLAYVGNTSVLDTGYHGDEVDVITSPRSTGSILKPFLYAAMLDEGKMLPHTLLPDVPTYINGFAPQNFSHQYDGAVPADRALIRSLNIPAVHMLQQYRYEKFHSLLKELGLTTLTKPPDHYGLSLILGGAEGTLWDITGIYGSMARSLNHYFEHPGKNRYDHKDFHAPRYFLTAESDTVPDLDESTVLSAGAIYHTFDALKEVYRPGEETGWRYFTNSKRISWKTGTSFGFRDGWAVGVTPEYVVGVWVGNADGEGRPGLTGTDAAAPVMFDIFSQLPEHTWFQPPRTEMQKVAICRKSGYRAASSCETTDTLWVVKTGLVTSGCPYHKTIHLSADSRFQVNSACADFNTMVHVSWFVLPPVQEFYFKMRNPSYKPIPPFAQSCRQISGAIAMDMIYPKPDARIFIPRDLDGKPGRSVFELAHRNPGVTVFWHLDGEYIGSTHLLHSLALTPSEGEHVLILIDENGETLERHFEVRSRI